MAGLGNIYDLQANGYGEKVVIYGANGAPVDWANLGTGTPVPARNRYKSSFSSPVLTPANTDQLVFELCPEPAQLKSIKITNSFYVDLFAQIMPAPNAQAMVNLAGHADRFLVGSMQTIALDGEDLFAELPEVAGQKLFIRFSTELDAYVPLEGVFSASQRVMGNAVCLFG